MHGDKGPLLLKRFRIESILVALIGGAVTRARVVLSNSRIRAVMEVKIDELINTSRSSAARWSVPTA